ncbi:MAG: hypothetical protein LBL66_08520, partial [Clostridiales bacterium]|nr:hypothetical protein [Clostridiales bacterium]
ESLGTVNGATASVYNASTDKFQRIINQIQIEQALAFGVKYLMYWELYCNELRSGVQLDVASGQMAEINEQVTGFYLIRPDGTRASVYDYIKGLIAPEDDVFWANVKSPADGAVFSAAGASSVFEAGASVDTAARLTNLNSGRSAFQDKIVLKASADGGAYEAVPSEAFVTVQENGRAQIRFVNAAPLSGGYRWFKVEKNGAQGDNLTVDFVKAYKAGGARRVKLTIVGSVDGGAAQPLTKYTVGSGGEVVLTPVMTDAAWVGTFGYKSSNRYVASVTPAADGKSAVVLGRTGGACVVTVKASGGGLAKDVEVPVEITVKTVSEDNVLIYDDFSGYEDTVAYGDTGDNLKNEFKRESDKQPNYGAQAVKSGREQLYYRAENIQFYYADETKKSDRASLLNAIKTHTGAEQYDRNWGYMLDWDLNAGSLIYELPDVSGGFEAVMLNYGAGGALDRLTVYTSPDNAAYTKLTSYITASTPAGSDWYVLSVSNKQIIPEGTSYLKFELRYTDGNKWNPQLVGVKIYGEADVDPQYVDAVKPTLNVAGTYEKSYPQNTVLTLAGATCDDNFCTAEELGYTLRVFALIDGARVEQEITDNTVALSMIGQYVIEYRAVDLAGNETVKAFTVEAVEQGAEQKQSGCKKAAAALGVGVAVAAACLLRKRRF